MHWLKFAWFRFRAWQLHRTADALLKESRYHRKSAKGHYVASAEYWMRADEARRRAVALEALES